MIDSIKSLDNSKKIKNKDGNTHLSAEDLAEAHEFGMLIRNTYFAIRRCSNAHCAPFDANGDQFVMLNLLAELGGVTQQDLVNRAGYDASTTGSMLKTMERMGLIDRVVHPEDGRAKLVTLTTKGKQRQKQLWKATEKLRNNLSSCIKPEQRQMLQQALQNIVDSMEELRP